MIFKETTTIKIKETDLLWRYIDLHKLIDLATNNELHFTRIDQFPDPFEGVTYKLIAQRYYAKNTHMTNPSINKEIRENHNKKNEELLENYKNESISRQKSQYVSCWIRSERESLAMWNLFSNQDGVAIKVRAKELIDYFKRNLELQPYYYPKYEFICGGVRYLRLNPFDPFQKPKLPKYSSFKKDVAFDFEKEYRFLIVTPQSIIETNPEFFRYPITKNFYEIIEIICHPDMEKWKFNNMKKLCNRIGLPNPKLSSTELRN